MTVSNTEIVIQAIGVDFYYEEGTKAIDSVDFFARRGEFICLLASNGSGKTTLIKVLMALLKPQKGEININSKDIRKYKSAELYRNVGLVLQNPRDQLFSATVEEDVAYGPRNLGMPEDEVQARVKEALEIVGAEHLAKRAIHHISYGEQKRVSIAGILAMQPSILILDEPTAGLDPAGESYMMKLLNKLNREKFITVILATHSIDMLPLFADRIYVMKAGKVLKEGTVAEIFHDHEMLDKAHLRLPYITGLLHDMKQHDGVPMDTLPLTVGEARIKILDLIPEELLNGKSGVVSK